MFDKKPSPYFMLVMLSQLDDKGRDDSGDMAITSPCMFWYNGVIVLNMGSLKG
jgi:hypothetical protein